MNASGAVASKQTIQLQGSGAGTSGTISGTAILDTTVAGEFTAQVYVSNAGGDSNLLTASFKISPFPWVAVSRMPTMRIMTTAVALGSRFYVLGGIDLTANPFNGPSTAVAEIFDPVGGTWSTGVPMPVPLSSLSAATINGKIYVVAGNTAGLGTGPGCQALSNVLGFDPVSGAWATKAVIPTPVYAAAAAAIGSKIYVVEGEVCPAGPTPTVRVYDTVSDTWSVAAPPFFAASGFVAGVVDGRIEALQGNSTHLTQTEFDPVADAWAPLNGTTAVTAGAATASVGAQLFAVGGLRPDIVALSVEMAAYDRTHDIWVPKERLPLTAVTPLVFTGPAGVQGPVADTYNGLIYAFGPLATWVYTPANDLN